MIDAVEETVLLNTTRAGVAVVTLNRPKVHNAFNPDVINRLKDIFKTLRGADGVRAVLIDGAGPSFSAGADLVCLDAPASNRTGLLLFNRNRMRISGSNELMYAGVKPAYLPEYIYGLATMGSCG